MTLVGAGGLHQRLWGYWFMTACSRMFWLPVSIQMGVCQTNGVTGLCCHAALGLLRRPSNRMSKALRASFHRWVQRALPLPVGSSAITAR